MTSYRFTYAGREWIARELLSEDTSRLFWRVSPARSGPPFPTRAEHREAVRVWKNRLTEGETCQKP